MNKLISKSAITYANSLFEADNNYDANLNDLNIVQEIVSQSQDLQNIIQNPAISINSKNEIINEVFKNQVSEKILNFLKILADKKRFNELNEIVQAYSDKVDEINNIKRVEVTSAVKLSDNQKQRVTEKLEQRLEKNVIINWALDKEIIGGLVVKIDDDIIDSSLKNKLEKLSKI